MSDNDDLLKSPEALVKTIEDQLNAIREKKKEEIAKSLEERIQREKEEAEQRMEKIEKEFEDEKEIIARYRELFTELVKNRDDFKEKIKEHLDKAVEFQGSIVELTKTTQDELGKVRDLSSELETYQKDAQDKMAEIKQDLEDKYGIESSVFDSHENNNEMDLNLDQEISKLQKIKELLGSGEAADSDAEEKSLESAEERGGAQEDIVEDTEEKSEEKEEGEKPPETGEEKGSEDTEDNTSPDEEDEREEETEQGKETAEPEGSDKETESEGKDDLDMRAELKEFLENHQIEAKQQEGASSEETEPADEEEGPEAETDTEADADQPAGEDVSEDKDTDSDKEDASQEISPDIERYPDFEKMKKETTFQEAFDKLEKYREGSSQEKNGDVSYFKNDAKIIIDGEYLISSLTNSLEEAKDLYSKLEKTKSPKEQFFIKQDIIRFQEVLRKLFLTTIKLCDEEFCMFPKFTQEILNYDVLKSMLERISMENWSDKEQFFAFDSYARSFKDAYFAKITPPSVYLQSILSELEEKS